MVSALDNISNKHGDSASVRVKDGNLKFGQGSNALKNIFNGSRYQKERQAAAEMFGFQGNKTVSVAEGKHSLTTIIKENDQNKVAFESKYNELTAKTTMLKEALSSVDDKLSNIDHAEDKGVQTGTSPNTAKLHSSAVKEVKVISDKEKTLRSNFSNVYQTNVGCSGIIVQSRHEFAGSPIAGKLEKKAVANEYITLFGAEHFEGGNSNVLKTLKLYDSTLLPGLVKEAAKSWYTPSEKTITTHRGQGITQAGIDTLYNDFDKNYTYSAGQFFSTSGSKDIADKFAKDSLDPIKVIFEIKGNSSNGLFVKGGLSFGAAPKSKEVEKLYSPLANFKIDSIKEDANGIHRVKMSEVAQVKKPKILPY